MNCIFETKMKTRIITLILLAVSMTALAQQKKVAVLDPICRDGSVNVFFAQTVRGTMENVISATDEYQAYDRTAFDKIMEEHHFQRSGAVNDADIRQMGVMAGVDYILVPELSAYDGYLSVIVKILNIETGRYDKTANEIMEMDPPKVKSACSEMARQMFGVMDTNTGQRKGELQFPLGRYVGEILDGKPHGLGSFYYNQSDNRLSYEGDWADGMPNGKGKLIIKDGSVYDGTWVNGYLNGQGTLTFSNGEKYEGNFSNGIYDGQGSYYYPSGSKYVGGWREGKESGFGIFYYASGARYEGNWEDGMYNGYGKFFYKSGCRFEGYFKNGNENGEGRFYYNDGKEEVGRWVNGKREGQFTCYYGHGEWEKGNYVNDQLDGIWVNEKGKRVAKYSNGEIIWERD